MKVYGSGLNTWNRVSRDILQRSCTRATRANYDK